MEEERKEFKLQGKIENLDIGMFLDQLISYIWKIKIIFSHDMEALDYFKAHFPYRPSWLLTGSVERTKILYALKSNQDYRACLSPKLSLQEFLQYQTKDGEVSDLTLLSEFCKLCKFLEIQNRFEFQRLLTFLQAKETRPLLQYMHLIIHSEVGFFLGRGIKQNRALWLHGQTNSGKSTMADIICKFLTTCRLRYANDHFTDPEGDNDVPNQPFAYNILHVEEVTKGKAKGPEELLSLIDCGGSFVKHSKTTKWGTDKTDSCNNVLHHFPTIFTSNYSTNSIIWKRDSSETQFVEAFDARIWSVYFAKELLPDLGVDNPFNVTENTMAQLIWGFVWHCEYFLKDNFFNRTNQREKAQFSSNDEALTNLGVGYQNSIFDNFIIPVPVVIVEEEMHQIARREAELEDFVNNNIPEENSPPQRDYHLPPSSDLSSLWGDQFDDRISLISAQTQTTTTKSAQSRSSRSVRQCHNKISILKKWLPWLHFFRKSATAILHEDSGFRRILYYCSISTEIYL